jgi:hypothetical protein
MPLKLTTAVQTGDLDSTSYGEVKIVGMTHRVARKMIMLDLEYGNTVDGEWKRGYTPSNRQGSYVIEGQEYDDMSAALATFERVLYTHLNTEGVVDPGSIE